MGISKRCINPLRIEGQILESEKNWKCLSNSGLCRKGNG